MSSGFQQEVIILFRNHFERDTLFIEKFCFLLFFPSRVKGYNSDWTCINLFSVVMRFFNFPQTRQKIHWPKKKKKSFGRLGCNFSFRRQTLFLLQMLETYLLSLFLSLSFSLFFSFSFSLSLFLSISVCLSVSRSLSLPLSVGVSVCLSV